jgi:hypothetical protein
MDQCSPDPFLQNAATNGESIVVCREGCDDKVDIPVQPLRPTLANLSHTQRSTVEDEAWTGSGDSIAGISRYSAPKINWAGRCLIHIPPDGGRSWRPPVTASHPPHVCPQSSRTARVQCSVPPRSQQLAEVFFADQSAFFVPSHIGYVQIPWHGLTATYAPSR